MLWPAVEKNERRARLSGSRDVSAQRDVPMTS